MVFTLSPYAKRGQLIPKANTFLDYTKVKFM